MWLASGVAMAVHRPVTTAPILPLAWEPLCAVGAPHLHSLPKESRVNLARGVLLDRWRSDRLGTSTDQQAIAGPSRGAAALLCSSQPALLACARADRALRGGVSGRLRATGVAQLLGQAWTYLWPCSLHRLTLLTLSRWPSSQLLDGWCRPLPTWICEV